MLATILCGKLSHGFFNIYGIIGWSFITHPLAGVSSANIAMLHTLVDQTTVRLGLVECVRVAMMRSHDHLVFPKVRERADSTSLVCVLSNMATRTIQRHPLFKRGHPSTCIPAPKQAANSSRLVHPP